MNTEFETPILFLIFNRPDVTQKVFDQIRKIRPTNMFVAADGPRKGYKIDIMNCRDTRKIIDQVDWPCKLTTLFRDENLGCGFAVCSAISWFFDHVEQGIVLEDDCLPDLSFFHFCGELLEKFKDDESIYVISGTNMQNGIIRGNGSYYFSNYPVTWGWASWRRAWNKFNYDIPYYEQTFKNKELDNVFQSYREKMYWRKKIKKGQLEKKSIWDYQWYYAIWKNKGIGITPNVNLIKNIGFRNNASHNFLYDTAREPLTVSPILFPLIHPIKKVDRVADKYTYENAYSHSIARFFRLIKENGIISILKYSLCNFLTKLKTERHSINSAT